MLIVAGTTACRCFHGIGTGLDGDGFLRADLHAPAAVDTFMVAHMAHIHTAGAHTTAAVVAAAVVHLYPDDVESVEKTVDRTQRADKAAEAPVAENTGKGNDEHDDELACKENSQHRELFRICWV